MAPVWHLKRIQDTQLEYMLLRYCLCTKPVHLTRMLELVTVAPALQHYEEVVKGKLERVLVDAGQTLKLFSKKWAKTAGEREGPRAPGPSPHISGSMDGNNGSCGTRGQRNYHTCARMHCTGAGAGLVHR